MERALSYWMTLFALGDYEGFAPGGWRHGHPATWGSWYGSTQMGGLFFAFRWIIVHLLEAAFQIYP